MWNQNDGKQLFCTLFICIKDLITYLFVDVLDYLDNMQAEKLGKQTLTQVFTKKKL